MNTPNNAAALTYMGRQLTAQEAVTMFANQDATIRSLRDELAALRATLAQPDALTGGDKRLTACIEGIGLAKMALMAGDPVKARERLDAISDRLDLLFESAPSGQTLAGAELTIAKYLDELATDPDPLDELDRRYIAEAAATIRRTATSAGTTGDDSEDAARWRFVVTTGKLPVRCSAGYYYEDGVIYPTPEAAIDAARRARGEGCADV